MCRLGTRFAPRNQSARQRAWVSIRVLRQFTITDLETSAEISRSNAQEYIRALQKHGYVRKLDNQKRNPRYSIVKNTGPHAPRVVSVTRLYDPNNQVEYTQ